MNLDTHTRDGTLRKRKRKKDKFASLAGILREMGVTYRAMKAGRLDETIAQKRIWVLDRMRAAVADAALEKIEQQLARLNVNIVDGDTTLYQQQQNGSDKHETLLLEHDSSETVN